MQETTCQRCGKECVAGQPRNERARPFRKGAKGLCAECIVTVFFKDPDKDGGVGFALPDGFDPEHLRLPHIQEQFKRILAVGESEMEHGEISWDRVIDTWGLPV